MQSGQGDCRFSSSDLQASDRLVAQGPLPDGSMLLGVLASAQTGSDGLQLAHNAFDDAWLKRHEQRQANYHNDLAQQMKDALYTPREGQTWSVQSFFANAHSPVAQAYELSKHVPDSQPMKSAALEDTVDRLFEVPWDVNMRVMAGKHSDYSLRVLFTSILNGRKVRKSRSLLTRRTMRLTSF